MTKLYLHVVELIHCWQLKIVFLMGLSLLISEFIGLHSTEMSGEEMPIQSTLPADAGTFFLVS